MMSRPPEKTGATKRTVSKKRLTKMNVGFVSLSIQERILFLSGGIQILWNNDDGVRTAYQSSRERKTVVSVII